jgi:ABC-type Fe3+ transport system substrate-binding protein
VYAGCVVATSEHLDEAHAFFEWLADEDGQGILADFGFVSP